MVGAENLAVMGMGAGQEVTDVLCKSPTGIVVDKAQNGLHTIKAILVATLGS